MFGLLFSCLAVFLLIGLFVVVGALLYVYGVIYYPEDMASCNPERDDC